MGCQIDSSPSPEYFKLHYNTVRRFLVCQTFSVLGIGEVLFLVNLTTKKPSIKTVNCSILSNFEG